MDIQDAAEKLAELGHASRLGIYRALVKAGPEGLPVSDIRNRLEIPASTLSHHIAHLIRVGLIKQIREGRVLRCYAQYNEMTKLIRFLTKECCAKT